MNNPKLPKEPKSIFFDFMGTCLNWHTSITRALEHTMLEVATRETSEPPSKEDHSHLALEWRQGFFEEIHAHYEAGKEPEDIDETHDRVLQRLLDQQRWARHAVMSGQARRECVRAWHSQSGNYELVGHILGRRGPLTTLTAWPDVQEALPLLRESFDVVVLANGTTRLQLDLATSSGLNFDLLLSSELLGMTKPDPEIYKRAISLLKRNPQDCIMVASHAYDLRAAKSVGMHTVYLQRWTEDLHEDMETVRAENDVFIDCRDATAGSGGLRELCELILPTTAIAKSGVVE